MTTVARIVAYLKKQPQPQRAADIAAGMSHPSNAVKLGLAALVREKKVHVAGTKRGKGGLFNLYQIGPPPPPSEPKLSPAAEALLRMQQAAAKAGTIHGAR